jgi:hypothetical protein
MKKSKSTPEIFIHAQIIASILCHIDYLFTSWYLGLSVKPKKKLQVDQNNALRFNLDECPRSSINAELFEKFGLFEY